MEGKPPSVFALEILHLRRSLVPESIWLLVWASSAQGEIDAPNTRSDLTCRFAALHAACLCACHFMLHIDSSSDPLIIITLLGSSCWPGESNWDATVHSRPCFVWIVQIKVAGTMGMLHQLHRGSSLENVQLYAGIMGHEHDRNDNVRIRQVHISKLLCNQHCKTAQHVSP